MKRQLIIINVNSQHYDKVISLFLFLLALSQVNLRTKVEYYMRSSINV